MRCWLILVRTEGEREMVQEHGGSNHLQQQHQHQLAKYGGGVAGTGVARASRKNKPKKVPQRGLGVAQLEKLRIEEQKKMEGGAALSSHGALGGGDGVLGHLPPPPPPSLALSALQSRSAADGGFPAALWSPVDPIKHPYKRSLCPQPPSPMVRVFLKPLRVAARRAPAGVVWSQTRSNLFGWSGEHGPVADGVGAPPNGAPFKPNVQQQRQQEQRRGGGGGEGTSQASPRAEWLRLWWSLNVSLVRGFAGDGRRGQVMAFHVRGHGRLQDDDEQSSSSGGAFLGEDDDHRRAGRVGRCWSWPEQIRVQSNKLFQVDLQC